MAANPATSPAMAPSHIEATVRPATRDDLPRLEWFGLYWHYRQIYEHTYRQQLCERRLMLVADVNGFPVGQVFIQFESHEMRVADGRQRAYLYSLRVMEPFQGRGLGTQLIRAAEEAIAARGYAWATIAVAKDNAGARRLYERLGYRTFGEDDGCWSYTDPDGERHHVNEPSWLLHKRLA